MRLSLPAAALFFVLAAIAFGQEKPPLPGAPNDAAVASYRRGEALLEARKYAEAAGAFDDAAKRAPLFYLAHYAAGNALTQAGQLDEAEKRYRESVAVDPKFARGWNALGAVQTAGGRHEDALASFDRALAVDGSFLLARRHRGQALLRLGRLDDAEAELRRVVRIKGDDADARVALASVLVLSAKVDEGRAMLDRILIEHPKNPSAHLLTATIALAGEDVEGAASALRRALEHGGNVRAVRADVGRLATRVADLSRRRGEVVAHVDALELLVAVAPREPTLHARLGAALITLYESQPIDGRESSVRDRALKSLRRSLELKPDQDAVRKLLAMYSKE